MYFQYLIMGNANRAPCTQGKKHSQPRIKSTKDVLVLKCSMRQAHTNGLAERPQVVISCQIRGAINGMRSPLRHTLNEGLLENGQNIR